MGNELWAKLEKGAWPLLMVILAIGVIIIPTNLAVDSVSYGDHASNSMLVAKAKSLSLLHGNYSRVGFYHPGPYFISVMAVGELLFYDLVRISNSPEGAHRLAIGFQNLLLLTLAFRLLKRDSMQMPLAVLAAFLGLGILTDQAPILTSLWPPHLYVVPAFLFTVAMVSVIAGQARAIPYFILGGGILVHGHASNIGLIPIMALGALTAVLLRRYAVRESLSLEALWSWVRPHYRSSVLVFTVFIAPIVVNTFVNFPGEIPRYFRQSVRSGNGLFESMEYVGQYWQAWPWLVLALAGLVFLVSNFLRQGQQVKDPVEFRTAVFSITATAVITFVAVAFYTLRGIDDLSHSYIGLWYLGSVGALVSVFMLHCLVHIRSSRKAFVPAVTAVTALAALNLYSFSVQPTAIRSTPYVPQLNQDGAAIDEIITALSAASDGKPVHLDLDSENAWEEIWPSVVGIVNRVQRTQVVEICIEPSDWHILFHDRARCSLVNEDGSEKLVQKFYVTNRDLSAPEYVLLTDTSGAHAYRSVKFYLQKSH